MSSQSLAQARYSNVVKDWKDENARAAGETSCPQCGQTVILHGMHWVTEICIGCWQAFHWGWGPDYNLYTEACLWPAETTGRLEDNFRANGRYVPTFR